MNLQARRALRQDQEPRRCCKTKRLFSLVILGCIIAVSNPSVSQQAISIESLMSSSAVMMRAGLETGGHRSPSTEPSKDHGEDGRVGTDAEGLAANVTPIGEFQCAICFFGLPRSYKDMVLPSIVKNVLEPNAKYHCDLFVHFYARKKELKGRLNPGGEMDPTEIYALKSLVEEVSLKSRALSSSPPVVIFSNDTERTFFDQRQDQIDKYLKTKDKNGKKLYFPWKQKTWKRSSLVNLLRQWHSIENAFGLMEAHMEQANKTYTRVAMLRNDAMYLSPIDVMKLDNNHNLDVGNLHFVIPPFANYPVNDRMVYGPYDAVKIWATKRFDLVEERAQNSLNRGNVMHSESFMESNILPAMQDLGYQKHVHPGLCFVRTRPDSKALFNDCNRQGTAKGFETGKAAISEIESILGRPCQKLQRSNEGNPAHRLIQC